MNTDLHDADIQDKQLSTADLAAAADKPAAVRVAPRPPATGRPATDGATSMVRSPAIEGRADDRLAPLFSSEIAGEFRTRWSAVQSSFVDDPKLAVRHGDELVAQVMKNLAESFSHERSRLENHLERSDDASTEGLRIALRQYRSFFDRLLTL